MSDEQRYVLGIAYQAGPDPRIQRGADGGRDYFTKDELAKAARQFMKSDRLIGINHADGTTGVAEVVESYVWPDTAPDWHVGTDVVVKAGDWLLAAVLDEPAWALYKSGQITGWSPQGSAVRRRSVQQ